MNARTEIARYHDELTALRRDIHANPELGFEEERTAAIVAENLESWGIEVHRGMARTGVVGTLRCGGSGRVIGLRADMDALAMDELNDFDHRSTIPGRMHGCGHDGHTTMLLGAARHLAGTRGFDGTVHFIFQPAEEGPGGAKVMIDEGLFERFPVDAVYGMHNMPRLPAGHFGVTVGPVLAAADEFTITVTGSGGHAALPHLAVDPVYVAGEIIVALQTIASRTVDPLESVVVSVTQMRTVNQATNVIPEKAELLGSARTLTPETRDRVESSMVRVAQGIAAAHGAKAEVVYQRGYPPTINHAANCEIAARAAARVAGEGKVLRDVPPIMGSEDFSYMLEERPGCFVFIGNGDGEGVHMCHSPHYDFNDDILPTGAAFWVSLVDEVLGEA